MNCRQCGEGIKPSDVFCGSCGARVEQANDTAAVNEAPAAVAPDPAEAARQLAASLRQSTENYLLDGNESAPKGCLVLILSFFGMPFRTLRLAGRFLKEISRQGALEIESDTPHLMWLVTAIPVVASIVFITNMAVTIIWYLADGRVPFFGEVNFIFAIIAVYFISVMLDWMIMLFAEGAIIAVRAARDIRATASAISLIQNSQQASAHQKDER